MVFLTLMVGLLATPTPNMAQTSSKVNGNAATKQEPGLSPSVDMATGAAGADYVIGPDDVLNVNVWKEPDLSRSVLVRPDGKITLPLLRDVQAGGSTPGQLQARLEKGLSDYISKPAVTVIVQEARSHKFNVLGEVQRPGNYLLNTPLTVLDAIALAGGFQEWAKVGRIYILRETSPGKRERIPFNYKKVVKGEERDIQLKVKDTIVVP